VHLLLNRVASIVATLSGEQRPMPAPSYGPGGPGPKPDIQSSDVFAPINFAIHELLDDQDTFLMLIDDSVCDLERLVRG
jgi:hypothetical protein